MKWLVLVATLILSCDREPAKPAVLVEVPPSAAKKPNRDVPPPTVDPAKPDYEDVAGTVKQQGSGWILEVEGAHPICLPFEAPAEARADGAKVRFTLYMSSERGQGCRLVDTLVSMRLAE